MDLFYVRTPDGQEMQFPGKRIYAMWASYRECALVVHEYQMKGFPGLCFMVIDTKTGFPFGVGETKTEALSAAREKLKDISPWVRMMWYGQMDQMLVRTIDLVREKAEARRRENVVHLEPRQYTTTKRLRIFEKTNGKCHYCLTDLEINGRWHVEHMMPRSRGGTNDMGNLVPACTKCNYAKGQMTAEEFMAARREA